MSHSKMIFKVTVAKRFVGIFLIISLLVSLFIFALPASAAEKDTDISDSVTSVTILEGGENIEVSATLGESYVSSHKGNPVYLVELTAGRSSGDLTGCESVAEAKVSAKMTFKVSLSSGTRSRISSRFIIAEKTHDGNFSGIGRAVGISNPEAVAVSYIYPTADSKKGLIISEESDAQLLGISNTVITLPINELFLAESGENSVSYLYGGKTYYFDRSAVSELDRKVILYSGSGINIYIKLVLSSPSNCKFDAIRSMYYEGSASFEGAKYFAVNIKNETGAAYFEALMKFLVSRYTDSERTYGFAGSYIIGDSVNANRTYNNMGEQSLDSYTENYSLLFRAAYTVARSVYSNAKLFVPIANNFNAKRPEAGETASDSLDYPAKAFLAKFNSVISASGDLGWNVAVSPYSSDRGNCMIWLDSLAESNLETPYITMANIDILSRFLTQSEYLYSGNVRKIVISDFAVATPKASESLSYSDAEKQQAASFAYGYYNAASDSAIEAVIYGCQFDSSTDSGNYGLWSAGADGTGRGAKKFIYSIFKGIDSSDMSPLTDFALPIIGINSFGDAIESLGSSIKPSKVYVTGEVVDTTEYGKKYEKLTLFDLTAGNQGSFRAGENAKYVEMRLDETGESTMLYAALDSSDPFAYMGVDASTPKPYVFDDSGLLNLTLKVTAPTDVESVTMLLRLYSRGGSGSQTYIYECTANITPGVDSDVTFDISALSDKTGNTVDDMKIWIKATDEKPRDGEFGLYLSRVSSWQRKGLSTGAIVMIVIVAIVLIIAGFFGIVLLKGYLVRRRRRLHKQRLEEIRNIEKQRQQRQLRKALENMFPESDYSNSDSGDTKQNGKDNSGSEK